MTPFKSSDGIIRHSGPWGQTGVRPGSDRGQTRVRPGSDPLVGGYDLDWRLNMRRGFVFSLFLLTSLAAGGCAKESDPPQLIGPGTTSGTRTLVDVADGLDVNSGQTGTFNWAGQSFVVSENGSFGDLRFNFYNFQKAPVAFGNLYLLTQEYLGL